MHAQNSAALDQDKPRSARDTTEKSARSNCAAEKTYLKVREADEMLRMFMRMKERKVYTVEIQI